ncbi:MAG TPA: helix-turn-helix transcriptional regulator, partial [Dehalococcoidia bacterium]|nr:helix-turn-helix transcriptional regulator [Dehalococcoidia bacterium]
MKLGDKIRQLREECGLTQGQLAARSSVSQGYLSQLENGEVKNPSAAVLLRVAQAVRVNSDELFEAAGYPTVRTLRQIYQE